MMRSAFTTIGLVILLLLTLLACQEADEAGRRIIFQEQFEGDVSDDWRYAGDYDNLLLVGGKLGGPGSGGQAQMCIGDLDWQDYAVSLWTDHAAGSLVVYYRFNDWDETYGFYIQENSANLFTRYDDDANVYLESVQRIGEDPVAVEINVSGDQVTTYIDGQEFYTFHDGRLLTGRVCIELTGDVLVDDFLITEP